MMSLTTTHTHYALMAQNFLLHRFDIPTVVTISEVKWNVSTYVSNQRYDKVYCVLQLYSWRFGNYIECCDTLLSIITTLLSLDYGVPHATFMQTNSHSTTLSEKKTINYIWTRLSKWTYVFVPSNIYVALNCKAFSQLYLASKCRHACLMWIMFRV